MKLKTQALLFFMIPVLVVFGTLRWLDYHDSLEQAGNLAKSALAQESHALANHIDTLLVRASTVANTTAGMLSVHQNPTDQELFGILARNVSDNPFVYGAAIAFEPGTLNGRTLFSPYAFRDGKAIKTIDIAKDSYDYTDPRWEWYDQPRKTLRPAWTEPYFDKGAGNIQMVTFSVPFFRHGKFAGVATVDLDLSKLVSLAGMHMQEGTDFFVLSRLGALVYHPDSSRLGMPAASLGKDFPGAMVTGLRQQDGAIRQEVIEIRNGSGPEHWFSVAPINTGGWRMIVKADSTQLLGTFTNHLNGSFMRAITMLVLITAALWMFILRILRPLSTLSREAQSITEGRPVSFTRLSGRNEVAELAINFQSMVDRLLDRERRLESANNALQQQKFALDQHAIVAITDTQARITYANDKFCEISGYSRGELIGQDHRILNSGHHPHGFFKEMFRTIAKGNVWSGDVCNRAKDGHLYWVATTIVPFMGEDGKPSEYVAIRTDVTQLKEIELALKRSEFRWKFAIDGSGAGLWDWDIPAKTVFFSKVWKEMLGYTEDEIGNGLDEWEKRVHPDDLPKVMADIQSYFSGATPVYVNEHRVLCKDGSYKWILDRGMVVDRSEDGRPLRVIGTHTDITGRKSAEEELNKHREHLQELVREKTRELQQSEHILSSILSASTDCVKMIDRDGNLLSMNPAGLGLIGAKSADAVLNRSIYDVIAPAYRSAFIRFNENICNGQPAGTMEFEIIGLDGTRRWMETKAVPFRRDEKSEPVQLAFTRDVTERKKSELAIERAEFLSNQALDLARSGHWHIDFSEGGEYYVSSDRVVNIFGDPPREGMRYHIMNDWYVNIEAADKAAAEATLTNYHAALDGHLPRYDMIHPYRRPADGRIVWIHVLGQIVRDAQGLPLHVYGVVMDISDLMRAQQELLLAKEHADRANQAKSTFLSNMSHELRTPMHGILAYGNLGRESIESGKPDLAKHRKYFDRIVEGGNRLMVLINDLLDLSKLEAGKIKLSLGQHDLGIIASEAVSELEVLSAAKEISIDISSIEAGLLIECDAFRIGQVLRNLVSNGIKFSPAHSMISIRTERISTTPGPGGRLWSGPGVAIYVSDEGVGIPESELESIFDEFVQSSKTSSKAGGTGLGLSICREIIELHAGTITAANNETRGSTIKFTLPLAQSTQGEAP